MPACARHLTQREGMSLRYIGRETDIPGNPEFLINSEENTRFGEDLTRLLTHRERINDTNTIPCSTLQTAQNEH
jgi:hypothetical protein